MESAQFELAQRPYRLLSHVGQKSVTGAICWSLVLGFLWFVLINHLRVEWTLNSQYNYGWVVPFLCLYLIWQNGVQVGRPLEQGIGSVEIERLPKAVFFVLITLLALSYFPTRLLQEANPDWRLVSWALAIEVVGLTLLTLPHWSRSILPGSSFSALVFPICFFLIAVPWPTAIETPVIQLLTKANTAVTIELLGWLGIPAVQHGNVIEISTGLVGIDEACSGIRSFQATLMIGLFLGQFFLLSLRRRFSLLAAGIVLAFSFNIIRTLLLVVIAGRRGLNAMAIWHDPAGVAILLACFLGLWLISMLLKRRVGSANAAIASNREGGCPSRSPSDISGAPKAVGSSEQAEPAAAGTAALRWSLGIGLLVWIIAAEVFVNGWYLSHETGLSPKAEWLVNWPKENPTFRQIPMSDSARRILRYDEAANATWSEEGARWQAVFLRWNPGRASIQLAKTHTPETCLPAAGHQIAAQEYLGPISVGNLQLPFSCYAMRNGGGLAYVFYCLWDDSAAAQSFARTHLTYANRLEPVLAGRRNRGQRSLEIAVWGIDDSREAQAALAHHLQTLIQPK
jgi:exosortase